MGIGIGRVMYGLMGSELLEEYGGGDNGFGIGVGGVMGVGLYIGGEGVIGVGGGVMGKGVGGGRVVGLMMGSGGGRVSEVIVLGCLLRVKVLGGFLGVIFGMGMIGG